MTIEETLKKYGVYSAVPMGDSMRPLFKGGRDNVIIKPITAPLKKGDVPLYKKDDGKYVLHRIVRIKNGFYYVRGDNRAFSYKITDKNLVGILTGYYKKGKYVDVNSFGYKFYVGFWRFSFPVRFVVLAIKRLFKKG